MSDMAMQSFAMLPFNCSQTFGTNWWGRTKISNLAPSAASATLGTATCTESHDQRDRKIIREVIFQIIIALLNIKSIQIQSYNYAGPYLAWGYMGVCTLPPPPPKKKKKNQKGPLLKYPLVLLQYGQNMV